MGVLPRVVTVDPTGGVARLVRAALDLTDHSAIQIDVPRSADALDEINHAGCQLLVTAVQLHDHSHGGDLAMSVKQAHPEIAVIVLGDADDPAELDEDFRAIAPFLYLHRPFDGAQFLQAFSAGLDGGDLFAARPVVPPRHVEPAYDIGPVPPLDLKVAERVVDSLLVDVGAMAIVLANRLGDVMLERGAVGYLDREQLTSALMPMVRATVEMGQLVGGQPTSLQFYDGERYDVFVLSVGFHHFMCLVFDGTIGSRQFGAVNRFGRRAAEDLITLLGINAFTISAPEAEQIRGVKVATQEAAPVEAPIEPLIERAEAWADAPEPEAERLPEPEPVNMEPIGDMDFSLFDQQFLQDLDLAAADDLFDPDKLAEIANETRRDRGPLSYEEARELGIIP